MQFSDNKKIGISAVLIAVILMPAIMAIANAHSPPWNIPTYAYINIAPNPAGIGQTVTVGMWLQIPPPTASAALGDRWHNFTVTVTTPDGNNETLGPFSSDATGGTFTTYTPDALGNYTFVFHFPGQVLAGENPAPPLFPGQPPNPFIGDFFEPSTSPPVTLIVQQEPIPTLPVTPLPTTYWTRPVQSTNGQWFSITGNWLGFGTSSFANTGKYNITGNYNPYSAAPKAAHIMWTKPAAFGGLVGGEFGGSDTSNYYSTSQYEPKWAPIIMNGIMYYVQYPNSYTTPAGWAAVDLRTGETIWEKNTTDILRCGQLLQMVNPNQFGSIAYLWANPLSINPFNVVVGPGVDANILKMYDAMTGNYILSIVNGTSMTLTEDQSGNLIGYYVNSSIPNRPTLNMWNSTQAILYPFSQFIPGVTTPNWNWRPVQDSVIDFKRGIVWTVPLPTNISGAPLPQTLSVNTVNSGVILLTAVPTADIAGTFNTGYGIEAGFDSDTGDQLWITNRTLEAFSRDQIVKAGFGVYVRLEATLGSIRAFSLDTGEPVWGPVPLTGDNDNIPVPNPYNSIGGYQTELADGVLYIMGFGGDVWAYDILTGEQIWYTNTNRLIGNAGSDTPYGVWPLWVFSGGTIADGVYFLNVGHEYSPPLFRGAKQLALNTTTGELIWEIMGFDVTNAASIADGYMTVLNAYDNQLYTYGKGPSAITVTASGAGIAGASPVTITGTITDVAAGTQQQAQKANFPNGVPVVSDASMSRWMEYVYMQQPRPTNTTGVPITISVIDANNNFREVGTTTSNEYGAFGFAWTPDIAGDFTIVASFEGSESYYPSFASAFFTAAESEGPTQSPGPGGGTSQTDLYVMLAAVAIIIAIAIVGALILMALRRRP